MAVQTKASGKPSAYTQPGTFGSRPTPGQIDTIITKKELIRGFTIRVPENLIETVEENPLVSAIPKDEVWVSEL